MIKEIILQNLSHSFDPKGMWALKNVDLILDAQKTTVMLGPSGVGKSTLLKIMSGFLTPDAGQVLYQGKPLSEQKKKFAFIPQEWNLEAEHSVFLYLSKKAQELTHLTEGERHQHVRSFIELFHLQGVAEKDLNILSTGQKARVVLAYHLMHHPEIVMMDEPFAHLDRPLRKQLDEELKEILHTWQAGLILVTHNLEEAFEKADDALLMIEGKLLKGDLVDFYHTPPSAEAARFLGDVNLIASKTLKRAPEYFVVKNPLGEMKVKRVSPDLRSAEYAHAHLMFRPEAVKIVAVEQIEALGGAKATVHEVVPRGACEYILLLTEQNMIVKCLRIGRLPRYRKGDKVGYLIDFNEAYLMKI